MTMQIPLWLLEEGIKLWSKTVSGETKVTIKADASLAVEVNVVTRVGNVPLKGVVVKIGGQDFGTTDAKGEIKDGAKWKRKKLDGNSVDITASYKNDKEKVREEKVTIKITDIDRGKKTEKIKVKHEIPKIRNAPGETDDVDFKTEYDTNEDITWLDDGSTRVLSVKIRICTLSLLVPYVNQRASNDTISTRPGLAQGKDPEAAEHVIKGPAADGKFAGGVLCYPSSVKMVLEYWGVVKPRADIMQECYDQWGKVKFKDRLDKLTSTTSAAVAPTSPYQGQYWLDTSGDSGAGYVMKRAIYEFTWETLAGDVTADYKQKDEPEAPRETQVWKHKTTNVCKRAWYVLEWTATDSTAAPQFEQATAPTKAKDGDLWKDTSASPAVVKKGKKKFKQWKALPESEWRTDTWGGATAWEYGWAEVAAMGTFKPAGTNVTQTHGPVADATVFPLSKPSATDTDVKAAILAKYKEWLGKGWPFVIGTTATAGHMMAARGVVVNKDEEVEWLIVNDPYGNLEGTGASYQSDEQNATSATGAGSDKGKNAYYRNATLGKDNNLRIKGGGRGFPRVEKELTATELAAKIVPGG